MAKPLIELSGISKSYGNELILGDIDFAIHEGEKYALIGRNGAGKSTLLSILSGAQDPDEGTRKLHKQARLGIVKQHIELPTDVSSLEYLSNESGRPEWQVQKTASEFDLDHDDLAKAPGDFSGGYQMRIKLVLMLLEDPNLLLLDEPVNYLDLETLILLEEFLKRYNKAFLIIAHDRVFLNNTCEKTAEIDTGSLYTYNGTVDEYIKEKSIRKELVEKHNKKLAKEIRRQQAFIDRFRAKPSYATRVKSRIKHVEKLKKRLEAENIDLSQTKITLPDLNLTRGPALRIQNLDCGYGDKTVISVRNLYIHRGDTILIAGNNGEGKTTLLRTIASQIDAVSGSFNWWKHTKIGYYNQMTLADLNGKETVLEFLERKAPVGTFAEHILMMAGNFLFSGDDLSKTVDMLSGGESARLALAGLLLNDHNTLILDEPTNHLDVETTEALVKALKAYKGTVFFVSHAQAFAEAIADRIYIAEDGLLKEFHGNYGTYIDNLHDSIQFSLSADKSDTSQDKALQKMHYAEVKRLQREAERLHEQIDDIDKEKSKILKYFFENPMDYAPEKSIKLEKLQEDLAKKEESWLEISQKIDTLRTK
jgi:ATP-binding cassette subfamily F protein 3